MTGDSARHVARGVSDQVEGALHSGVERLTDRVGGAARRKAIILLACVLALDAADKGAVGAVAFQLERAFHVGNTRIGLMVTVSSLVGAVGTIPMGALTDRRRRVRLLWVSIVLWSAAEVASGLVGSFAALIAARVALGAVTATAGPVVASLTGDLFPGGERGRMYGFILTGEFLGVGVGVIIAGLAAQWFGWRAAFFVLGVPGVAMVWALRRYLPEPARGGQSRIEAGAESIASAEEVGERPDRFQPGGEEPEPRGDRLVLEEVEEQGFQPAEPIVAKTDPRDMTLWQAVGYVLRVRTNVILIVASSLGYFFFSGLRTFAVIYLRGQYGVGEGVAVMLLVVIGLGAIAGLLIAGNLGDRLVRRKIIDGRLLVGVVGFLLAALLLAPGVYSSVLWISLPLYVLAGACVAAPNPSLDAARLDVMPARMWGRAEGVRTALRQSLEAFAPLIFGVVSEVLGGGKGGFGSGVDLKHATVTRAQTAGLEYTFLLMLVPLLAGGLMLLAARRSYPVDVVSAAESDRRTGEKVGAAGHARQ